MADILVQRNINYFGTHASLFCSHNGFYMVTDPSEIKDHTDIWEPNPQNQDTVRGNILLIADLHAVLPEVNKRLPFNLTIDHVTRKCSDGYEHSLLSEGNKVTGLCLNIYRTNDSRPSDTDVLRVQEFCRAVSAFCYTMLTINKRPDENNNQG